MGGAAARQMLPGSLALGSLERNLKYSKSTGKKDIFSGDIFSDFSCESFGSMIDGDLLLSKVGWSPPACYTKCRPLPCLCILFEPAVIGCAADTPSSDGIFGRERVRKMLTAF